MINEEILDTARMTGDGYVKQAPGKVRGILLSYKGATAGDVVALRDGGPTGSVVFGPIHIGAANGHSWIPLALIPISFGESIYYSEIAAAPLKIEATVVYE